jgi:hypothetical protein
MRSERCPELRRPLAKCALLRSAGSSVNGSMRNHNACVCEKEQHHEHYHTNDHTERCGGNRADTGVVTLIQRFGSAANLNIHLHCLVLDGVYLNRDGVPLFHEAAAPSTDELEAVLLKIITRTMRLLTRLGALIEEPERTYLAETDSDGALKSLQAASCTYRIALGPRAGQKVLSLRQDSPGSGLSS